MSALLTGEHIPIPVLATEGCLLIGASLGMCRDGKTSVWNNCPLPFLPEKPAGVLKRRASAHP